jgi:hypothetical protein
MRRLLDDYRFNENLRYEQHKLQYVLNDEQYSLSGVFAVEKTFRKRRPKVQQIFVSLVV